MHAIFLSVKPFTLIVLLAMVFGFASLPASATVDVWEANTQFMTPDELQQIVELVLLRGKTAEVLGEPNVINYVEARQGGLRQYITVEAILDPDGKYTASRVHFTQESWTKTPANDDVIDQWVISIQSDTSAAVHRQLTENNGKVLNITLLPAESGDTRNVVRSIVHTFLQE